MDVSNELVALSDQMNAIDLAQPVTVTILDVFKSPSDKRVHIVTDAYGPSRPFKPSKTVLRDIAQAWGIESQVWIGRRLTLFNDPTVLWAGSEVGGIRVSAMSHIDKAFEAKHAIARTKSKKVMIQPLPDVVPTIAPVPPTIDPQILQEWLDAFAEAATLTDLQAAWKEAGEAHVANHPQILGAKDARKAELTGEVGE
jgi:hypothetical protein